MITIFSNGVHVIVENGLTVITIIVEICLNWNLEVPGGSCKLGLTHFYLRKSSVNQALNA